MIGKVVAPGRGFKGLVKYLLEGDKEHPLDKNRVQWVELCNMLTDDPAKAYRIMQATAAKSKRVKKPVYHYVISWHENEAPSADIMRQVAYATCADLELDEHQMLLVAHNDTDHRHVHIVVNRVHPETGVAWRTSNDYKRIEQSLRRQSEALGFELVPGRHTEPDKLNDIARRPPSPEVQKAKRERRPARPGWSPALAAQRAEALRHLLDHSQSWTELEVGLNLLGLTLTRKGQGLVFADEQGELKLSRLGKTYRLHALEERYASRFPDQGLGQRVPPDHDQSMPSSTRPRLLTPRKVPTSPDPDLPQYIPPEPPVDTRPLRRPHLAPNALWARLAEARSTTDLALIFYRMGLATDRQLARAFAEQDRAQEAVDAAKPLLEQLLITSPDHAPPAAAPSEKISAKPSRPNKTHRRQRNRDRDR